MVNLNPNSAFETIKFSMSWIYVGFKGNWKKFSLEHSVFQWEADGWQYFCDSNAYLRYLRSRPHEVVEEFGRDACLQQSLQQHGEVLSEGRAFGQQPRRVAGVQLWEGESECEDEGGLALFLTAVCMLRYMRWR